MPARPPSLFSVEEAIRDAPTLTHLRERIHESTARMDIIRPVLPAALRAEVTAGPVDTRGWRLLVPNNAVAAKLRQLKPTLKAALEIAHLPVSEITVKISKDRGRGER